MKIKKDRRRTQVLGVIFFLIFSVMILGCRPSLEKGHYEGNLSQSIHSKIQAQPVGLDVEKKGKKYQIAVRDLKGELITEISLSYEKKNRYKILIPLVSHEPFIMAQKGSCFVQESTEYVNFCYGKQNFVLNVSNAEGENVLNLSGDLFAAEPKVQLELPKRLTVSEAVNLALDKNFESMIEFEKAFRAKKQVQEAYLGLIPSINVGTFLTNVALQWVNIPTFFAVMVGDIVPFLLPNRWMKAHEYSDLAKAEEITQILMKANLATEVEDLAYNYERDRKILEYYGKIYQKLSAVFTPEVQKQVTANTAEWMQLLLNSVALERINIGGVFTADRFALAESLGYLNPEVIEALTLDSESSSIERPPAVDPLELSEIALRRSFELKQIDYLIKVAHTEKIETLFRWIDPAEDPGGNLGFALIPQFQIAKSKIRELNIQRTQLQAVIIKKAYSSADAYDEAIKSYSLSQSILEGSEKELDEVIQKFQKERTLEFHDFEKAVDGVLSEFTRFQTIIASFRVARSKMDRLQLQGYYNQLLPKPGSKRIKAWMIQEFDMM